MYIVEELKQQANADPITFIFDGVIVKCYNDQKKRNILKCLLKCQEYLNMGIKISDWNPDPLFVWNMIENGFLRLDITRKVK